MRRPYKPYKPNPAELMGRPTYTPHSALLDKPRGHRPRQFDEGDQKLRQMLSRKPRNERLVKSWATALWGQELTDGYYSGV